LREWAKISTFALLDVVFNVVLNSKFSLLLIHSSIDKSKQIFHIYTYILFEEKVDLNTHRFALSPTFIPTFTHCLISNISPKSCLLVGRITYVG